MSYNLVNEENYRDGKYFAGKQIVGMFFLSGTPQNVVNDGTSAYVNFDVGTKYNGCSALISVNRILGTPYVAIRGQCAGIVENGILPVEFYGSTFVKEHTFSISVILFK